VKHKPAPPNQLLIFEPPQVPQPAPAADQNFEGYQKDDRILVISGQHKGKTGTYFKSCSNVFPDYCRVFFDLRGRQRNQEYQMILKAELKVTSRKN
jgi:hypothetical protein